MVTGRERRSCTPYTHFWELQRDKCSCVKYMSKVTFSCINARSRSTTLHISGTHGYTTFVFAPPVGAAAESSLPEFLAFEAICSSKLKIAVKMPAATNGTLVPHAYPEVSEEGFLPDGSARNSFDYIIVGAGCAGSALASRLSALHPDRSVLLLEAGPNPSYHPLVPQPLVAPMLRGSELDWKYESVPQVHLAKRPIYEAAGKALGGGSVINYGNHQTLGPYLRIQRTPQFALRLTFFGLSRSLDPRRCSRL